MSWEISALAPEPITFKLSPIMMKLLDNLMIIYPRLLEALMSYAPKQPISPSINWLRRFFSFCIWLHHLLIKQSTVLR